MKAHPSAFKHGVSPEDAERVPWIEPIDDGPPVRELWLGFDTRARMLETVALVLDSGTN